MPRPIGRRDDACYADDIDFPSDPDVAGLDHDDDKGAASSRAAVTVALGIGGRADADCDLIPDYMTLAAGARVGPSLSDAYTVDRYGNRYGSAAIGFGTPGPGVSAMTGYLRDEAHPCVPPEEAKLESFLTGVSRNVMSAFGAAAGLTTSNGMTAHEFGVGTPGASVTMAYGWMLHDEKHEPNGAQ
jgi:hypothetical protein